MCHFIREKNKLNQFEKIPFITLCSWGQFESQYLQSFPLQMQTHATPSGILNK
jgi:hypothetical protein